MLEVQSDERREGVDIFWRSEPTELDSRSEEMS
jgi:hypothetical protein